MFLILACTVLGFFIGFSVVVRQRKLRPGTLLSAALMALISVGVLKAFHHYLKKNRWS